MMSKKLIFLGICGVVLLIIISSLCFLKQEKGIEEDRYKFEFTLSMDKTEFLVGEPINVTIVLTNVGKSPINVTPLILGYDVGFEIKNSTNEKIPSVGDIYGHWEPVRLNVTESLSLTHDLSKHYWVTYNLTQPDTYSIKAIYHNYHGEEYNVTRLESNTLSFTITSSEE